MTLSHQDVFAAIFQKMDKLRLSENFKPWSDGVRRIFSHREGIVLAQAAEQQCFKVVTPTIRAKPVKASQTTLQQAQGERKSL